jgi:osmotically-inducible protein OsmY
MLGANVLDRPGPVGNCQTSTRKEERMTEAAVEARFRQSPHWDFGSVTYHFFEGVLTLRGHVRSYYVKQMAQELVRSIPTVEHIDNRLRVVSAETWR